MMSSWNHQMCINGKENQGPLFDINVWCNRSLKTKLHPMIVRQYGHLNMLLPSSNEIQSVQRILFEKVTHTESNYCQECFECHWQLVIIWQSRCWTGLYVYTGRYINRQLEMSFPCVWWHEQTVNVCWTGRGYTQEKHPFVLSQARNIHFNGRFIHPLYVYV